MRLSHLLALAACVASLGTVAPAAGAAVVLNEIDCETDWVELVNTGDDPVDITGFKLADVVLSSPDSGHFMLFGAITIPGHGRITVDKGTDPGEFPFGISCSSDTIRLGNALNEPVDDVALHTLTVSSDTLGRYPDGTGAWVQTVSTKNTTNLPSSATAEDPAWIYDPGEMREIDLTLSDAAKLALEADPDTYVSGAFSIKRGATTYGPYTVGIRLKGSGSFQPLTGKAAFKIKFNEFVSGQRFFGLKRMTLNNGVQDPTLLHETLSYELFRALGVPAPRTGHALVDVNDDRYGVYINVETPDEILMQRLFASTQHLFEGTYTVDVTPEKAGLFEIDEGSESDLTDLDALVAAVAADGDFSDNVAAVADIGEMVRMWAVERYLRHWDGYAGTDAGVSFPNNYYLHSDSSGRFSMLPWGTDQALQPGQPEYDLGFGDHTGGVMFKRCLTDMSCLAGYRAALTELQTVVQTLDLDARITELAAFHQLWRDEDVRNGRSTAEILAAIAATRAFAAGQPARLDAYLNPQQPTPARVTAASPAPFAIRATRRTTSFVTTKLTVPASGRIVVRVTLRDRGRAVLACSKTKAVVTPSDHNLRCALTTRSRRLLRERRRRLTVRATFAPASGATSSQSIVILKP